MMRPFVCVGLLLACIPFHRLHAQAPDTRLALRTAAALYDGIRVAELDNGLRVYLKPIPDSTSVTTVVVYKVGSADEDKTFTGLSHYLEHLMFKGTATLKPGDIDRITFRAGGNNNAYTSADLTAYHFTLPASGWKAALEVEADRMHNLRVDKEHEFDKEKGAVINELNMGEDSPWDLEYKAILPMLFGKAHPYGHPIIGEAQHVKDATEKVITEHYRRWYQPNNASLVMVGGFDADEALGVIKKLFSSIPRAKLPERKALPESMPKLPSRVEMASKFSVPRLMVGFPAVKSGDEDHPAMAVLEAVLSGGKRSRLYRALVEDAAVASSASAENSIGRYPGWTSISVEVLPDKDRAKVEKLLLAELAKLREEPVGEVELKRAQQLLIASAIFSQEDTYGLANHLARSVTLNDLDFARKYLPGIVAVTPADVQRVAKKYLTPERSATVWSVPGKAGGKDGGALTEKRRSAQAPSEGFDLKKAERVELPNGLVLMLYPTRRLPLVEAQVVLRESGLYQPDDKLGVAALTGMMLDEGSSKRSGPDIAEAIENVGGALSLSSGGGSVKVLSPDRKLGLGLLLECLTQPAFPKDAFDRAKARLLAELGENEAQPETRASREFRALAYGKHPLGRPSSGTTKTVAGLTVEDCQAFHKRVFVPNNTILAIAGDFDPKEVVAEVKELVAGWKKTDLPREENVAVEKPAKFSEKILSMPQAAQLQVFLGHAGIKRTDPDYYKLLVMDHVLGTGPGFTDRLSARLRDREGLAYSVSAAITTSAGRQPGLFTCYIGTDNDNFAKVKGLFLEELNRIRDTKPAAEEVADAKTYLIGSRMLRFATTGGIAGQLAAVESHGLGLGYLDDFRKGVAAVTPDDVQAVAKKHLDPSRMVLVAAGAVDKDGKPIVKK